MQVIVRTRICCDVLESLTVICTVCGVGASPVTANPLPDAGMELGVMRPTVPGTANVALYGGVPPVITKFEIVPCAPHTAAVYV